jgi:hypothetical protein
MFSLSIGSFAQDFYTNREIFDFDIGDVFQYTDPSFFPDNGETIKILDKQLSEEGDTLIYQASRYKYFIIPYTDSVVVTRDNIQLQYTDLDSSFFDYIPQFKYDSLISHGYDLYHYDTIVDSKTNLCDVTVQGYSFGGFEFGTKYLFGKGLGLVEEEIPDGQTPDGYLKWRVLKYFQKAGSSCGEYDITNIRNSTSLEDQVYLYPNPASGFLHFKNSSDDTGEYHLKVYNLTGKLLIERSIVGNEVIDISDLPNDLYLLHFRIQNTYFSRMIVKK